MSSEDNISLEEWEAISEELECALASLEELEFETLEAMAQREEEDEIF